MKRFRAWVRSILNRCHGNAPALYRDLDATLDYERAGACTDAPWEYPLWPEDGPR